ncbi:MAG: bifunctional phosphopantothenoylcysteine decarboxylase/phosphopantothenate--cysteine ligase CoaBC [Alphaproteobacteria bacterium]|nr:bifunctional phosphopantothenoylcysteine decarboxylase/phosphopantothenate--cysteine ligase CoaBC [Alphaproteobacteria bacterium]
MKKILFIISGSISAYKSLDLLKYLINENFDIEVILTKSGQKFLTPLSVSSLINKKIHTDIFSKKESLNHMEHINLTRNSDLVVVCPASANIIAKLANGYADDLASTTLAAANKKIFIVPAMNKKMWENPANKKNIKELKNREVKIIGPTKGNLACGEIGFGRMEEIKIIKKNIKDFFYTKKIINKKKILVTAGPTIEAIDPVRYISNFSSGKQGYEIANCAYTYGAETILITGQTYIEPPEVTKLIKVKSAEEMFNESIKICKKNLIDIAFLTAAVSDWKIKKKDKKYKKNENIFNQIKYKENKDILHMISNLKKKRPKIVCGFAAETNLLINNARKKLLSKKCDFIFANKISDQFNPIGSDFNEISVLGKNKQKNWSKMTKKKLAEKIIKEVSLYLN